MDFKSRMVLRTCGSQVSSGDGTVKCGKSRDDAECDLRWDKELWLGRGVVRGSRDLLVGVDGRENEGEKELVVMEVAVMVGLSLLLLLLLVVVMGLLLSPSVPVMWEKRRGLVELK